MQFLLILAIFAMVAMPATAFRAAPRFLARQIPTQQTHQQIISKNTMLFSEEPAPETPAPETPPPAERNPINAALFNKGTFIFSSLFLLLDFSCILLLLSTISHGRLPENLLERFQ